MVVVDAGGNPVLYFADYAHFINSRQKHLQKQLIDKRSLACWLLFPSYFKVQKVRIGLNLIKCCVDVGQLFDQTCGVNIRIHHYTQLIK